MQQDPADDGGDAESSNPTRGPSVVFKGLEHNIFVLYCRFENPIRYCKRLTIGWKVIRAIDRRLVRRSERKEYGQRYMLR